MNVVMKADPEDVSEVVRFLETKVVIANVADDSVEMVLSEADDSVQAVADSVGGATRSCGSRGRRGCTSGARVPKGLTRQKKSQK